MNLFFIKPPQPPLPYHRQIQLPNFSNSPIATDKLGKMVKIKRHNFIGEVKAMNATNHIP
ncbi:MAG: hypothetical protein DRQ49_05955 [Gammaproteobacteria bacterium]|nr:MAG: hypothetical protein DRQ49_05955 [Gammaproteobacteria bacterium]RKZ42280.1 MAG: hypothetical protein DRQ41_07170 [Gammaproteobacteria bacterium]RKZ73569.1 MAG: hypothetical protein DRQ57_13980 [Gammaproteobacteria bacterium]